MQDMYFYHSFPSNTEERLEKQVEKGLKIIESMAKIGFLLCPGPKPVEWGRYLGLGDGMRIKQKRICFTFIRTTELRNHIDAYGKFSIEFDENILQLGAMPMFYVPTAHKPDLMPAHLLVMRLWRAMEVLKVLDSNCLLGVKGLFGLLYPTEDNDRPKFENYHLREWRITGNTIQILASQYGFNCLLEPQEKEMLKDYFHPSILNECFKFYKLHGKHVLNYAKRFIVPDGVIENVKLILRKELGEKCPEVITINTFEEQIPKNRTIYS